MDRTSQPLVRRALQLRALLLSGSSVAALAYAPFARAQQNVPSPPPPPTDTGAKGSGDVEPSPNAPVADIVVTGIRQSLQSSQNIKRNSDTVVDAITAEDIGALPDRSVTESLQRVPGVQISHFEAQNDPDHISPEGQDVVIRGLPYVQTQFNGRDAFTASKGRALSLQDIPPELLNTIEVYKNQTADMIEGGIAGTVNLVTRRPLDGNEDVTAFTGDINWPDLNGKTAPDGSGLISRQWDTEYGRFGILGDLSYSQNFSQQDSSKVTSYTLRENSAPGVGYTPPGMNQSATAFIPGLPIGQQVYIPTGGGVTREDYNRARKGYAAAAQWESPDKDVLATFQFIRTDTSNLWTEHTLSVVEDTSKGQIVPIPGTPLAFDGNGVLKYGSFTTASGSCETINGTKNCGVQQQEISRGVKERAITDDYSAHVAWKATDRLKFDFDAQYSDSSSSDLDVGLYPGTWANESLDLTGTFPKINYSVPTQSGPTAYTNLSAPNANFWRAAIDHEDNNVGRELTFRADGDYRFGDDNDFFRDVKFGARYADRTQRIRSDGYNWGNLSEAWQGGGAIYASTLTPPGFGTYSFGSFLNGAAGNAPKQTIYGFNFNNAAQYALFIKGARAIEQLEVKQGGSINWNPLGQRSGVTIVPIDDGGDGYHTPAEISRNLEKTTAGYARLDYGVDQIGGTEFTIDGNVGIRYIHTDTAANGGIQFPTLAQVVGPSVNLGPNGLPVCPNAAGETSDYNICQNTPAQQAAFKSYADGSSVLVRDHEHYDDLLPSFNLRVAPIDELQFRLAYSKGITRPSFNDLRDFVAVQFYEPATNSTNNPIPGYEALATGNPKLRPTKSDNLDATAEWYFAPLGFVSTTPFYKKLTNVYAISNGVTAAYVSPTAGGVGTITTNGDFNPNIANGTVGLTNGSGQRENVYFLGINNSNRAVSVKGIELDYTQVYSFLPDPFDGAGINFNYTYVDADRLPDQYNIFSATYPNTKKLPFPGVSKHNLNIAGFYEKYGVSARLAYTWRSSYLVVAQDINYPSQPVFSQDTGQVDCSLYYTILDHADIGISDKAVVKIGFDGSNVLGSIVKTNVQINQYGLQALRAAFTTDTRWTFGIRGVF